MLRTMCLAVAALVLGSVPVQSDAVVPAGAGHGYLRVSGGPVVVRSLAPGLSGSGTFTVRNETRDRADVRVTALAVIDRENSCISPEKRVPGERCSLDGGELSDWLRVTITRRQGASEVKLWSGRLAQLRGGVKLSGAVPARTSWTLRVALGLPWAAGNDTMTDSVSFGLRVDAACKLRKYHAAGPAVHVGGGTTIHAVKPGHQRGWTQKAWRSASRGVSSMASWPGRLF